MAQMPEMLWPALMNNAAEARHTNSSNNVYSIKSWPSSSRTKRTSRFFIDLLPGLIFAPLADRDWCGRDGQIAPVFSAVGCGGNLFPSAVFPARRAENDGLLVVESNPPVAGFLQSSGQRRIHRQQNGIDAVARQGLLPVVFHVHHVDIRQVEFGAVKIAAAVHENFASLRRELVDQIIAPFIVRKNPLARSGYAGKRGFGVALRIVNRLEF